jgi:hypothetical protein
LVTSVPRGDRRGWDATDSTWVTEPRVTEVLSTRTGSAPAGAMASVPGAPITALGAAPAGSERPAGIPRGVSGSRSAAVPGAEATRAVAGGRRLQRASGSTASLGTGGEARGGRRLGAGPARPSPSSAPARRAPLPRAPLSPARAPSTVSLRFPPPSLTARSLPRQKGQKVQKRSVSEPPAALLTYSATPAMFI